MITTNDISNHGNRFAVHKGEQTIQFVVWDIKPEQAKLVEQQLATAFNICRSLDDIENHMRINGYDCDLEDIY